MSERLLTWEALAGQSSASRKKDMSPSKAAAVPRPGVGAGRPIDHPTMKKDEASIESVEPAAPVSEGDTATDINSALEKKNVC